MFYWKVEETMSEIPKGTQFIGQADARKLHTERVKPAETKLSPEQQKVAEVMKESGEVLEKKVVDAREEAGKKLQGLHGKELVDAGKKQMVRGLLDTVKAQVKWAIGGGIIGATLGAAGSRVSGGDMHDAAGLLGATWASGSAAIGGEVSAPLAYNKKVAGSQELTKVGWSDWLISVGARFAIGTPITLLTMRYLPLAAVQLESHVFQAILNPITVRGLRNVMTGLRELKKGVSK